ncbi:MAG: tRNA pseudouridine(55) synthase TruB [Rectinemataceae bacterium]
MNHRSGFVLLDKPAGLSSFTVLGSLKKALPGIKMGHTGTLDSFATGLMVAVTGNCTRLTPWFTGLDKEYRALVRFGAETATLDPQGEVVATSDLPGEAEVRAVLPSFEGDIMQCPPEYSAIHVGGERAWRLALRGEAPEMAPRKVRIDACEMESFEGSDMSLYVRCSSGTYVRSLARDIARACGSRAHLAALRRLSVGPFVVEDAVAPGAFDPDQDIRDFDTDAARGLGLAVAVLDDAAASDFLDGKKISPRRIESCPPVGVVLAAFDRAARFLGIVRIEEASLRYVMVTPAEVRT